MDMVGNMQMWYVVVSTGISINYYNLFGENLFNQPKTFYKILYIFKSHSRLLI